MTTRVLVVASDAGGLRWTLCARLQGAGFDVSCCEGPGAPSFLCPAAFDEDCSYARGVDVVVLDMWLDSDIGRRGLPSWHVLRYYRERGLPVVALIGPDGLPGPLDDDGVFALRRDDADRKVIDAVRSVGATTTATGR